MTAKSSKSKEAKNKKENIDQILLHIENKYRKSHYLNFAFNLFSKKISDIIGNAWSFIIAFMLVIIWALSGHFFHYSDTWQLVINTSTTIITFLIVFLIQHTQNRDTEIINLKIDELIRSKKGAKNPIIDLDSLSDSELKDLEKAYKNLQKKRTGH